MALNKRKVLDAARKHAQKGAKAKALKEYNKLLKEDPRDAKLLLEVGDAYRRWGQNDEAIAQYGKVAQQYRQDGFDARAVAVFKQILNLDPKNYAAYVSLAELYQRMGLDSEAVSALQTAADGYHQEGRKSEALELLRQMAALDPTNTTSRLKVAELLRQEGMESEALAEYQAVVAELENQEDRDQLVTVYERLLELKGDDLDALGGLVRQLVIGREFEQAEPLAVRALNVSAEVPQYELLMDLYAQMGADAKLADATRGLAQLYRDRGDEDKARELTQRLPVDEVGSSPRLKVDVSDVAEPQLDDEELLDESDDFLDLSEEAGGEDLDFSLDEEAPLDLGTPDEAEAAPPVMEAPTPTPTPTPVAADAPAPEGDPDQLLAEASVYLRYGKREQAIASLRAVLAIEPDHRMALEKLGDACAADEQPSEAVTAWSKAAAIARDAGDASGLASLRERISEIDPAVAESLGDAAPAAASPVEAEDTIAAGAGSDFDFEVELDGPESDGLVNDLDAGDDGAMDFGAETDDFEIELDEDSVTFGAPPVTETPEAAIETDAPELDLDVDLDLSVEDEAPRDSVESEPEAGDEAGIEFEFDAGDLGVDDDATEDAAESPVAVEDDLEEISVDFDFDSEGLGEEETVAPVAAAESAEVSAAGQSTATTARIQEELEEAEFYIAQDMLDEAEPILQRILDQVPNHPGALLRMGEVAAAKGGQPDDAASQTNVAVESAARISPETTARFDEDDDGQAEITSDFDMEMEIDVEDSAVDFGDASSSIDPPAEEDLAAAVADAAASLADDDDDDATETQPDTGIEISFDDEDDDTESGIAVDAAAAVEPEEGLVAEIADAVPDEIEIDEDPTQTGAFVMAESPTVPPPVAVAPEAPGPVASSAVEEAPIAIPDAPVETIAAAAAPEADEESFDLREALADVLAEDEGPAAETQAEENVLSTVEDGFESIFSDFKKGVSATLEEGDFDTRYDLGIAYREMGLYEDAIGEFRVCLDAPGRRFDSLHLMGICSRDLGRFEDATNHLEQALALPDLPEGRTAGVYFDLADVQDRAGDPGRATASLRRVLEIDGSFPGALERLTAIESGESSAPPLASESDGFESFDDLFAEEADEAGDEAVVEAASTEAFESFDDLVDEAEAVLEEATLEDEAEKTAPPIAVEPEAPTADDDTQSTTKSGRRKRISFV